MTMRMPDELRVAVVCHPGVPVELVDDQTHQSYVLLPSDEFKRLQMASKDDLSDTYAAQAESAMRAGWGAPSMDEYDDYDAHRKQE